jgi:putative hydrolase of HD superfamily
MTNKEKESIIGFYQAINRLKGLKRSGWLDFHVKDSESVADHTFGLALLVMVVAPEYGYDLERCLTMALVHDLAEALVGDITPRQNVSESKKIDMEEQALGDIFAGLQNKDRLLTLWRQVAHRRTPEGRLVKDLDKLEMALQARMYEKEQGLDLTEFLSHCKTSLGDSDLMEILDVFCRDREEK